MTVLSTFYIGIPLQLQKLGKLAPKFWGEKKCVESPDPRLAQKVYQTLGSTVIWKC